MNRPAYLRIYATFLRNSLVRDMQFRATFIIECISSTSWVFMNIGFYLIVFQYVDRIGEWGKWDFFVFIATTLIINSMMQTFFMPGASNFSELIRTGGLDFLLVKPADVQFMITLQRVSWASVGNFLVGIVILIVSVYQLVNDPTRPLELRPWMFIAYPFYVLCGLAIMYSLMISLAATSIWLGRNQSLYDFWFYITNFSRYPMEIYHDHKDPISWRENYLGFSLWSFFLFIVPVLVVINVPARIFARPELHLWLGTFALVATLLSLLGSRWIFRRALAQYRSASS